jgi:hypothetical protein
VTAVDPRLARRRIRKALNEARIQRHRAWQQRMLALQMRLRSKT